MRFLISLAASFAFFGCASKPLVDMDSEKGAPFTYAGRYLIKIPVVVNKSHPTYFIFDTGAGVNLLSRSVCIKFDCKDEGHHVGHRMSGQKLEIPMSRIDSLIFAGHQETAVPVGVWEMKGFLPPDDDCKDIEGFLSLGFFRSTPFTMDYKAKRFLIETDEGLKLRRKNGFVIPIEVVDDGPSVTIFMPLKLSDGSVIRVEIDLGGNILTLNKKLMSKAGADASAKTTEVENKTDETGHSYVRYFSKIRGPISPAAAPQLQQSDLTVMFQEIIYDGLIANDYMKRFTVTYDLANSQIILTP